MGLTTRQLQQPHYYEVLNEWGRRVRTTGKERDAQRICEIHPTWKYKIVFPPQPLTIDVPYVRVAPDLELPAQQILPQSNLEPLDL